MLDDLEAPMTGIDDPHMVFVHNLAADATKFRGRAVGEARRPRRFAEPPVPLKG